MLARSRRCNSVRHKLRSEEHTSELQSRRDLVCRLLLEKKKHQQVSATFTKTPVSSAAASTLTAPSLGVCRMAFSSRFRCFFFNDAATTEIYTLSLHDALPI